MSSSSVQTIFGTTRNTGFVAFSEKWSKGEWFQARLIMMMMTTVLSLLIELYFSFKMYRASITVDRRRLENLYKRAKEKFDSYVRWNTYKIEGPVIAFLSAVYLRRVFFDNDSTYWLFVGFLVTTSLSWSWFSRFEVDLVRIVVFRNTITLNYFFLENVLRSLFPLLLMIELSAIDHLSQFTELGFHFLMFCSLAKLNSKIEFRDLEGNIEEIVSRVCGEVQEVELSEADESDLVV